MGGGCQPLSVLAPHEAAASAGISLSRYQIWGVSPIPYIPSSASNVPLPKETRTFRPALLSIKSRVQRACSLLRSAKPGVTPRFGCRGKSGGRSSPRVGGRAQSWLWKQQISLQVCPFLFSFFFSNIIKGSFILISQPSLTTHAQKLLSLMPQNAKFQAPAKRFLGVEKPPALKATCVFSSKFRTSPVQREPESHGSLKVKVCFY